MHFENPSKTKLANITVWCAQHDRETLAPAKARAYELPSLSGQESDDIVLFLMSLSKPTPEMIASIDAAIEWFKESEIKNIKKEYFTNADGKKDYRMVPCTDCEPLWARFYELETTALSSVTVTELRNMISPKSVMNAVMVIVGTTMEV